MPLASKSMLRTHGVGSGNQLLDRVLGAALHSFSEGEDEAAADAAMEGRKPCVVHSAPGQVQFRRARPT